MESTGKLERSQLYLAEFKFDVVHCLGIKHQPADSFSQGKTTGIDQMPIQDEVPVLCIPAFILKKREGTALYIQNYDVLKDRECIGILEVYSIATSSGTEYNKRPNGAYEFIQEPAKDSYCRKASSTVELQGSAFNYN